MARKKAAATPYNGGPPEVAVAKSAAEETPGETQAKAVTPAPPKINNYNLTELKNTCDDILKKYLSRPDSFTQNHLHTDIRLALGYVSIVIAAATGLYGWKSDFERSKPLVTIGVALYFILTFLQTVYIYFVEKNVVFVGKRKTIDKRILTERLTVSSKTVSSTKTSPPMYSIDLVYLHSANAGKALLKRGREAGQKGYNAFFDAEGNMDVAAFEQWLDSLVTKAISS